MLDITKKINADLDAIRSRVEDLRDDFRLAWEDADDNAKIDFSYVQYHAEDAAEIIESAQRHLESIVREIENAAA